MQRTAIILAYLFIYVHCFAQLDELRAHYPFVHYTPREGLANNRARALFQDSKGRLYIATFAGLSVYDGSRFINYNSRNGLSMDLVNDVVEVGEDSIWIFPNSNNINCLVNGRLKDIVPADKFTPLINQFFKCSDGNYYALADEGFFRWNKNKFMPISFPGVPNNETKTFFRGIEIDHKLFLLSNPDYKYAAANLLVYDLMVDDKVQIRTISMAAPFIYLLEMANIKKTLAK